MIVSNNRYCRNLNCVKQRLRQNDRGVYFEVRNALDFSIFFILQYGLPTGVVTFTSNVIPPRGKDKINFPSKGINVCVNVLQSNQEQTFLFNICLANPVRTCIEVSRSLSGSVTYREVLC